MARATGRGEDRSSKAFRALLALYPAVFRDEYGRELGLLFIDRYRNATSPLDRATLWLDALSGIAVEAPKEHCRMLIQDLRFATRSLLKHRVMTFTIVMTLGLGIGANAAIFSLLNAVVLRSLPVSDPDALFAVRGAHPLASANRFTGPMLERLRGSAPPDVALAAMSRVARVYIRTEGQSEVEPAEVQLVSGNYFPTLGLRPVLGRMLPDVAATEPAPVAVVSHRYWQRRFGGRDDVLGRTLTINGGGFTIIGVGPQGFAGVWLESPVDLWVPLSMDRQVVYWGAFSAPSMCTTGCLVNPMLPWFPQPVWWLDAIARTPPGRTAATTSAFNAAVQDFLREQEPAKRDARIVLEPFAKGFSAFRRRFETPLYVLVAMAALVLLIACANVANLLLARAAARQRELAIKMSLGAGRARLVHQLLTESVLLVLLAAGAALLFARWSTDLLIQTASGSPSGQAPFAAGIDYRVWGFTAAVAFFSVVLFGLLPAWRTTRLDLAAAVRAGARGSAGLSATRPARFLVVAQVALALVLVTGMGLLVRSFQNLLNVDLGFDRHLISVAIDPAPAGWKPEEFVPSLLRVLDSVASVHSVQSAALAGCGLLTGCGREDGLQIEGYTARPDEQVVFLVNGVTPSYFATVGTRLMAGRSFDGHDVASGPKVAVVNRTLARKYFKDGQALGKRFGRKTMDVEIVGIVDDARLLNVRQPAIPTAYYTMAQRFTGASSIEVRSEADPRQVIAAVRAAIGKAAPELAIAGIAPITERVRLTLSQERLTMFLASGFGALALGLAGFGLFGLLSYIVSSRSSEFAIRIALGASREQVLWGVVRWALWLLLGGVLLGAPIVALGGRLVETLFFGISPYDWRTFLSATVLLLGICFACSVLPAWRASRVDPLPALRQE